MPKKRKEYPNAKPNPPVHPSLSSSVKAKEGLASSQSSVNEKLQQLRLEQRPSSKHPLSSQESPLYTRSQPSPLQLPQTGSSNGLRRRRRGPPGPAPPNSWLQKQVTVDRQRHTRLTDLSQVDIKPLNGTKLPMALSLQDCCFRALARDWTNQIYINQFNLAGLDIGAKETLCYYVARFSPGAMTAEALHILFFDDTELEDATGGEGLRRLDLTGSISDQLRLEDLASFFLSRPSSEPHTVPSSSEVPDTWDESPPSMTSLSRPKFQGLTHLSLAYPQPDVKFASLLKIAPHLASLTHLSLAGWPKPSLRPNSTTASFSTPMGDVQSSLGTFYSDLDNDFSEPAHALRQLSKHLLCLRWLDLSACWPWVKCLSNREMDWYGNWAGVETVVIDQGILPRLLRELPEDLDDWLSWFENEFRASLDSDLSNDRRKLGDYLRREYDIAHFEQITLMVIAYNAIRKSLDPHNRSGRRAAAWDIQNNVEDSNTSTPTYTPPESNRKAVLNFVYASKDEDKRKKIDFAREYTAKYMSDRPGSTGLMDAQRFW